MGMEHSMLRPPPGLESVFLCGALCPQGCLVGRPVGPEEPIQPWLVVEEGRLFQGSTLFL